MEQAGATLCKTTALPLGVLRARLDHEGSPRQRGLAQGDRRSWPQDPPCPPPRGPWGVGITRGTVQGRSTPRL